MTFAGMVRASFVDDPGQIACVLFVPGCNYDCFYCHNRPLLSGPQQRIPEEEALAFLQKRVGRLDSVVVTGGEPTLQPGLIPFLRKAKALGYRLKLDTNGSRPDVVAQVLETGLCSYFAVDYKAPASRYAELCRGDADAAATLATLELLRTAGVDFEARTTVIPQLTPEDLLRMARELPPLPRYVLNPYRRPACYRPEDEALVARTPHTPGEIAQMAERVRAVQPNVTVL
ncbi:MAG: anaerobic ribonucleoside-triphosphate reductase activating protein [Clostridiales bacterium]|nr:anaerobic ribonucleoside-triphosphate reductase activating protein [Clostridiales bacterium]